MAPALSIAPREPPILDTTIVEQTEKPLSHRRRALASVDNLALPMEDDEMGLQNQPSSRTNLEMDQMLVELNSDLALLQAIKTLESGGDGLSTVDPDANFLLSEFNLTEAAGSEGDVPDRIKQIQFNLERKLAHLQRRLRIIQAKFIGKRVSEEAASTFEKCSRGARREGGGRPVGLKTFLKSVETTAALQAGSAAKAITGPKYYHAGTSKIETSRPSGIGVPAGTLSGLEDTAGALHSHLSMVKHELDSDATASSSGAESNDEAVPYNNPHQQPLPIEKRALWTWQRARAAIAYRYSWLQAQVQELEYKRRQHDELQNQVREAKGPVEFEGEPVGYEGSLPGAEPPEEGPATETCARVRPLRRETFKKRKLLQMNNLHMASAKAAKPSDVNCSCVPRMCSCAVCTGRAEAAPRPASVLSAQEKVASVDAGYHPVLSDIREAGPSLHMAAIAPRPWFRPRVARPTRGAHHSGVPRVNPVNPAAAPSPAPAAGTTPKPPRRHPTRAKRGRPPLTRRTRDRDRDEDTSTSGQDRTRGRLSTESRSWRRQSYDIDNIVIPQSVAANTRPQILNYKEILTPKWRVMEIPETSMNNGVLKSTRMSLESEEEDISDQAVRERHARAEGRERERYVRKRRARRDQQQQQQQQQDQEQQAAKESAAHYSTYVAPESPPTPHEEEDVSELAVREREARAEGRERCGRKRRARRHLQLQHDQQLHATDHAAHFSTYVAPDSPPAPSIPHETVRPYTPRQFPLADEQYADMLANMPADHRPSPPPASPPPVPEDDVSSSLSPLSPPGAFDGDDPDDAEWDPHAERANHSFR